MTKRLSDHPAHYISHGLLLVNQEHSYPTIKSEHITDTLNIDISYTHKIPPPSAPPVWIQKDLPTESSAIYELYQEAAGWRLDIKCQGRGTFIYSKDGIKVYWLPKGTDAAHYLFGIGLSLWFELHGIPCLHGNSLVFNDHAIALLGPSQSGKSTLTASLLKGGFSLLTDDLVVPRQHDHWLVYPAPEPLRMWPSSIRHLLADTDIASLERVHASVDKRLVPVEAITPNKTCQMPNPLQSIYLLDRDRTGKRSDTCIKTLGPAEALIALLANSISGGALKPLGVEKNRLKILTQMVSEIPVKLIHYPNGYQHLQEVTDILIADLGLKIQLHAKL